ncbi:ADP-heptose--LPS heptosyltransferase [Acetobacter pomorum]|uniref:ADP-heptose--LPS heptosyltransferase n=1 Tax=Acetobacter pomorum TaxID=65959 RepID=A0A2G4RFI4_9PROT|nr:glycosyltransferase family 9 protein [Acetobacter pomorum]PHY95260.1 ADP-heptose--LPS heptosyltransferase [Acetobacter pomorum]
MSVLLGSQKVQKAGIQRVLVIRLGALGDFVQSFGPFQAIRQAYPAAHITLLTTTPFIELARLCPWFDEVLTDTRPRWTDVRQIRALRQMLRGYDRVYDLQTSARTARYFLLAGRPATWCGHVGKGSLTHLNPWRDEMHTRARQRDQLRMAGIVDVPQPDISWLRDKGPEFDFPYILIVPGAAQHRPAKRWPARRYGELAAEIFRRGVRPVLVGHETEQPLAQDILKYCPQALNLMGKTTLPELAGVAARAQCAVGNDTGPMHLAAVMGCKCVVLFSADSNPGLTAPLGWRAGQVRVLRVRDLALLCVQRVAAALWWRH